jgi:transcriptional regulator with XRE-family HTH domain
MVGVSQPTISAWEKGAVPDYAHLAKIAKFLDLSQSEVSQLAYADPVVAASAFTTQQAEQLDRIEERQRQLVVSLADVRQDLLALRTLLQGAAPTLLASRRSRRQP